jgi:hypothetical protein
MHRSTCTSAHAPQHMHRSTCTSARSLASFVQAVHVVDGARDGVDVHCTECRVVDGGVGRRRRAERHVGVPVSARAGRAPNRAALREPEAALPVAGGTSCGGGAAAQGSNRARLRARPNRRLRGRAWRGTRTRPSGRRSCSRPCPWAKRLWQTQAGRGRRPGGLAGARACRAHAPRKKSRGGGSGGRAAS